MKCLLALLLFNHLFIEVNSLNILGISTCYTGHITPSSGIFRALSARGHSVEVFVAADCCESKVSKLFSNFSSCFSAPIYEVQALKADSQIEGLFQMQDIFYEKGTRVAFHKTREFLESHHNYDVIVTDYVLLGSYLAAELFKIPVVAHYVGPFSVLLEAEPDEIMSLVYMPETMLPNFVLELIKFATGCIWHYFVSEKIYAEVNQFYDEFPLEPKLRDAGISFGLPFVYYYMFSNFIHMGPPDVFLTNVHFMQYKNNIHHVGYIPDQTCFKPLSSEIEAFVEKADKPVVYLSLGTLFTMEITKLEKLLSDFAAQKKYDIIWSASDFYYNELKAKGIDGGNVLLVTNVAQLSLLMKEKVNVFVTHAGNSKRKLLFKY